MVSFFLVSGKKLSDGKGLSGKGRLTCKRIDAMQNFYGRAIRDNEGDAKAMAQATRAILKHYSSTPENPQHDDCPKGSSSWCSYQRDISSRQRTHKPIKNPLPPAVVEVIQPLFNRLSDERLLAGCEKCYTQNPNECLHHVIWGMAPKEQFNSSTEISTAISLGVLQFNQGFEKSYEDLLRRANILVNDNMKSTWQDIDKERIRQSNYRASPVFS